MPGDSMVATDTCPENKDAVFVIKPNRSLSWKQSKCLFLFFVVWLVGIAVYFSLKGAWLILPFAGLELVVLGSAFYFQCRWSGRNQTVRVGEEAIEIIDSIRGKEAITIPTGWSKVKHLSDSKGWYPSQLFLGSHGRYVEVGSFLIEHERRHLAASLQEKLGKIQSSNKDFFNDRISVLSL